MKRLILITVACLAPSSVLPQGTVDFRNLNPGAGLNAPVYMWDMATKPAGANYHAVLMAGPTSSTLSIVGSPTSLLTGAGAGYFLGGTVAISGVAPGGVAFCEVIAWDTTLGGTTTGATEAEAFAYWQAGHGNVWFPSNWDYGYMHPFQVVTGNPYTTPPGPPAPLVGLQWVYTPEPSSLGLAGLAAAVVLIFRRVGGGGS